VDRAGHIIVDGVEMCVDMQRVGRLDHCSLLIDNASHETVVEPEEGERDAYGVYVAGVRFEVKVQDERSRRLSQADRGLKAPAGELAIRAPIPGLVVKVLVCPGMQVEEGDSVLVLEAMKMENELRAPRAGRVHEVRVEPGTQVTAGAVLLTLR